MFTGDFWSSKSDPEDMIYDFDQSGVYKLKHIVGNASCALHTAYCTILSFWHSLLCLFRRDMSVYCIHVGWVGCPYGFFSQAVALQVASLARRLGAVVRHFLVGHFLGESVSD